MVKLVDKKFRSPREWSNTELRKFSHLFPGETVNISGWFDEDKEGNTYKSYFTLASNYKISNYKTEARGYTNVLENEFYLDLEQKLDSSLQRKFDIVFNHTVLEHVFEVQKAFNNLCAMSNDIVILVVPFLQEEHGEYGDYWRFSPQSIDKLFEKNNFALLYINYNDNPSESIYIFAIGSRQPEKWAVIKTDISNKTHLIYNESEYIGRKIITNSLLYRIISKFGRLKQSFFNSS
tara:strand:+ start:98 stop:802 length:705 start_codon:yes stop_codon:yes gene_type:complete